MITRAWRVVALVLLAASPALAAPRVERPLQTRAVLPDDQVEAMLTEALRFVGTKYEFGAAPSRDDAVDCSSLVLKAFRMIGTRLPRVAWQQGRLGLPIPLGEIRRGDRLYFKMTERDVPLDHTAIYLGNGQMLHAFPGLGVSIQPLAAYRPVLVEARR